jgi:phosphatidylglycerophosphate synthase
LLRLPIRISDLFRASDFEIRIQSVILYPHRDVSTQHSNTPALQHSTAAYTAWSPSPHLRDYPTINRFLSAQAVRFLIRTPLRPNQITLIAFAVGAAGIWFFAQSKNPAWLIGALFFQLQYILDNCDGEIARAKKLTSKLGYWLDQLLDMALHILLFPAIAFGLWRFGGRPLHVLWLGIAAGIGVAIIFALFSFRAENQKPAPAAGVSRPTTTRSTGFKRVLERFTEGDFSFLIILVAALGGLHIGGIALIEGFVWAAGIGAPLFAIAVPILGLREAAT